jgi:4-diphosphocytidyl-2-C-methyl-D-erythritol kinase
LLCARMDRVSVSSPAKINLLLAVTGKRADGFHELVSVVAQLGFGDTLHARLGGGEGASVLECGAPGVPVDRSNLVLRAADGFARETGWRKRVEFRLEKEIPVGAGLGGGSSNAIAALRALETLSGLTLGAGRRLALAAELGSDCPLFWHQGPVVMRGRGERLEGMSERAVARLSGRRVLVFKPAFAVATAEAYRALAARPEWYADAAAVEASLARWAADPSAPAEALLENTLERPVFAKWVALPALLDCLRERHGLRARMSGSGSACFALLEEGADPSGAIAQIRAAWGAEAFIRATRLA